MLITCPFRRDDRSSRTIARSCPHNPARRCDTREPHQRERRVRRLVQWCSDPEERRPCRTSRVRLVTEPPYGVGWWAPHPGTSRRIFISDQLDACATSVATNMVEAALHWLELLDAIDHEDAFQADVIQMVNGEPRMVARPRTTPLESLGPDIARVHQIGVARALSTNLGSS